ncbi:hypothetical protein DPMN_065227 [Dreissena polymorpha]|uniref:Uncharacterized protein n=1 Tax=Dreissena polymorpha TaxID=45954 RepID=A0A9D4HMX5_DREPO|nr:hypothetical protein DPMN_065227 [Dreissena polymorpha]
MRTHGRMRKESLGDCEVVVITHGRTRRNDSLGDLESSLYRGKGLTEEPMRLWGRRDNA